MPLTAEEKLAKALVVLGYVHEDAQMALQGTWDRSDDGFEARLNNIDRLMEEIGAPPFPTKENAGIE